MTYTLGDVTDLGNIEDEKHRQVSDLDFQSMPLSESANAIVLDYQGVKRVIRITAIYPSTTIAGLRTFISAVEGFQSGAQTSITFHSDLTDTDYNVMVDSFEWSWEKGIPGQIKYSLVLFEGM